MPTPDPITLTASDCAALKTILDKLKSARAILENTPCSQMYIIEARREWGPVIERCGQELEATVDGILRRGGEA